MVGQESLEPAGVAFGDDRAEVVVVLGAAVAGELPECRVDRLDERVAVRFGHQHVVGRDARLARIEPLAPGETAAGHLDVGRVVDEHGALAAEFERHRCQMAGRGLVDDAADLRGARVEDVVEALVEEPGGHLDVPLDHRDRLGVDIAGDQCGQRGRRGRGDLRRLADHGVAGGDGGGHRQEQQLDRVVPGGDHQSDTEGFGNDVPLTRLRRERKAHPAGLRPLRGVLAHVGDLARHRTDVGREPLDGRFAQIGGQRLLESVRLQLQHPDQAVELFPAPLHGPGASAVVGRADSGDGAGHVDGRLAPFGGISRGSFGDGHASRMPSKATPVALTGVTRGTAARRGGARPVCRPLDRVVREINLLVN